MSDILPLAVSFYKIDLHFSPEVIFRCDPMAILHVSNPLTGPGSIMTPSVVHHLLLLPQTLSRPRSIAVAVGSIEGKEALDLQAYLVFVCSTHYELTSSHLHNSY